MASRLRTNTDVKICVGPFLDATDGVTPEVALTVANTAATLIAETDDNSLPTLVLDSVAGDNGTNTLAHITNDGAGYYSYLLVAANVNRLGRCKLAFVGTAHGTVFHEFEIVPAVVYDSMVLGTDVFQVDITQLLGTAWLTPGTAGTPDVNVKLISADSGAADNAEAFFDGTGYAGGTIKLGVDSVAISGDTATADNLQTAFQTTLAEAAAVPAANASIWAKVNFLFLKARNKITQTSTTMLVKADDGTTTVATSTVSDDGSTYTRNEFS